MFFNNFLQKKNISSLGFSK